MTALELDPAADPVVYAALDTAGYVRCEPVGPAADGLDLAPVADDRSVLSGGREWYAAFELTPAVAGRYQIVCEGPGASFAVGDRAAGTAFGSDATVALLALPLSGLVVATTTTIFVLTRRRAAQERLFAPWTGGAVW